MDHEEEQRGAHFMPATASLNRRKSEAHAGNVFKEIRQELHASLVTFFYTFLPMFRSRKAQSFSLHPKFSWSDERISEQTLQLLTQWNREMNWGERSNELIKNNQTLLEVLCIY